MRKDGLFWGSMVTRKEFSGIVVHVISLKLSDVIGAFPHGFGGLSFSFACCLLTFNS